MCGSKRAQVQTGILRAQVYMAMQTTRGGRTGAAAAWPGWEPTLPLNGSYFSPIVRATGTRREDQEERERERGKEIIIYLFPSNKQIQKTKKRE